MRRWVAAAGSAAYFAVAAGAGAVLVPWRVTGWEFGRHGPWWLVAQAAGVVLIGAGVVPVVSVFVQFARAGGTPLPLAPTRRLVVSGFNRYVRNPVYVGSLLIFTGQALLFGSLRLLAYTAVGWAGAAAFVRWYEEPTLTRRFGAEYESYRRAVNAWWPRLRPWRGPCGLGPCWLGALLARGEPR
jgi:protein-S-isoprenylcysteine O-methyltransferase Ste14